MKRAHIPLKEKLAAALYEMQRLRWELDFNFPPRQFANGNNYPTWRAYALSADEVLKKFDWHHIAFHAHLGSDKWSNLTPMLREEHREQTRKDIATIAKGKRIQKKEAAHSLNLSLKHVPDWNELKRERKRRWPSRPFPKRKK